ncbi:GEM-like protein 7 [Tripterygium wilfordii]|uniref:GEM-like protein 7 n=1 Tax=Tripterygium wilfordii TaxID=458696 RepID=UPI0018F81CCE|nr:GEM-like protein 7 [Tripterygium wilfordii]
MKNSIQEEIIRIPVISATTYQVVKSPKLCSGYLPGPDGSSTLKQRKIHYLLRSVNKLGKKADSLAAGVREHMRLTPKIIETLKGKLSWGAKTLQVGGMEKIFGKLFNVKDGEKLLKASQCYLSTTAGPIAGILFISTDKIAFSSERLIKFSTPNGESTRLHYKVLIPVSKIKGIDQGENMKNPSQKYIEGVTVDEFDFWFMGFFNYKKTFKHLQHAIPKTLDDLQVTC